MNKVSHKPRAIVHKNILDEARAEPEASIEELARRISAANTMVVQRVLDEYGDPARNNLSDKSDGIVDNGQSAESHKMNDEGQSLGDDEVFKNGQSAKSYDPLNTDETGKNGGTAELDEAGGTDVTTNGITVKKLAAEVGNLTDVQRDTLFAIFKNPDAPQHEVADRLKVSASTVNRRVNAIEDFEWSNRQEFVEGLFEDEHKTPTKSMSTPENEEMIEDGRSDARSSQAFNDPEVVHKVVHACFESDRISEDEEMRILRAIID
jgi:hypothetical protein